MAQPSSPNYPSSYDDDDSLLGNLENRQVFYLENPMSVDDLIIDTSGDISNVNLPCYVLFEGGEIVYCESVSGTDKFIIDSLSERGVLGTNIQPHGVNERVYVSVLSVNHNLMRAAAILAQKYHGLVGLDAAKGTPVGAGARYVATDTDKIYICFDGLTWTQVNYRSHGDLGGLLDDDHDGTANAYHNDSRASTWHGLLSGVHIAYGDDHNHYDTGQGSAVMRVAGGLDANKPTGPSQDGHIYFSTDLDGGTFFIGNGGIWEKIGGVPSGAIAWFDSDCPSGWTRYSAADNRYPKGGAVTAAGNTGGTWSHTHTYSEIREHYHVVDEVTGVTSSSDAHDGSHTITTKPSGSGSSGSWYSGACSSSTHSTTTAGDHSHTCNVAGHNTDNAGAGGAETDSETLKPESLRIMFCQKD